MDDVGAKKWHRRFLRLAEHVAEWSKDPSSQVGCVLVNEQRIVVGMGYNGFPRRVRDDRETYEDRAAKYLRVIHAEANALLNASGPVQGATAYVTHPCCSNCMGLLIQSGVSAVVTYSADMAMAARFAESFAAAQQMASDAGVRVVVLDRRA